MTAAFGGRPVTRRVPRTRMALGSPGMLALLARQWAALLMLGLDVPTPRPDFAEVHSPLMILGFRALNLVRSTPTADEATRSLTAAASPRAARP